MKIKPALKAVRGDPIKYIGKAKSYIKRGHGSFGMVISMISHSAIWFKLLPLVNRWFENDFIAFAVWFFPGLLVGYLIFGWWDYRRGTYRHEAEVAGKASPYFQDLFRCMELIGREMENEEVQVIGKKWQAQRKSELT